MNNNHELQPITFHSDTIFIVDKDGEPYVPVRPISDNMGVDWASQFVKLKAKEKRFCVVMITTQLPGDNQRREVVCIHLKKLSAWLYSIDADKVAPHLKEKVELYQDECDDALNNYWFRGQAVNPRLSGGAVPAGMMLVSDGEYQALHKIIALLEEKNEYLKNSKQRRRNFTADDDATVIRLHKLGLSHREIGREMGRPHGSIHSCQRRLRAQGVME